MKIIWSPSAIKNLDIIFEWLKEKNEKAAINIYNELFDSVEKLKDFPQIAAIEPILSDFTLEYRSLIVLNYKVVYTLNDGTIYISAVWDCRQDPQILKRKIKE